MSDGVPKSTHADLVLAVRFTVAGAGAFLIFLAFMVFSGMAYAFAVSNGGTGPFEVACIVMLAGIVNAIVAFRALQ